MCEFDLSLRGRKVLDDYFRIDTAKTDREKKWLDFEFVLFVQREDFVSVVWVGLREGEPARARTSGYSYRKTQHTNH